MEVKRLIISLLVIVSPLAVAAEQGEESALPRSIAGISAEVENIRARNSRPSAEPQAIPAKEIDQGSETQPSIMKAVQALGACLGIFFIVIYLMKRFSGAQGKVQSRRIRVIERTAISSKAALILVELEGRT
ncbi:MAG: hypothetical protein DCC75_11755, partial [Proteobacteria bacterium]